jgi:hypothetical protein
LKEKKKKLEMAIKSRRWVKAGKNIFVSRAEISIK